MTTPTIQRIKYYLQSSPIAGKGSLPFKVENMPALSVTVMRLHWEHVADFVIDDITYKVLKFKGKDDYCVGVVEKTTAAWEAPTQFTRVLWITLAEIPGLAVLGYPNLRNVNIVSVAEALQGSTLGRQMYRCLVKVRKFTLLGDLIQFFGARRLWARMSQMPDIIVDVIDYDERIIIERDRKIHHGLEDHDFDTALYSYGCDKAHIRLIMTDVK